MPTRAKLGVRSEGCEIVLRPICTQLYLSLQGWVGSLEGGAPWSTTRLCDWTVLGVSYCLGLCPCIPGPQGQVQTLFYTKACRMLEGSTPRPKRLAFCSLQRLLHLTLAALVLLFLFYRRGNRLRKNKCIVQSHTEF